MLASVLYPIKDSPELAGSMPLPLDIQSPVSYEKTTKKKLAPKPSVFASQAVPPQSPSDTVTENN